MTDYSYVRGFNYQPGYAYNSYEAWRFFDPDVFRRELGCGKTAFPKFNTVRYWLSYDAFRYEEDRQAANFETALCIADSLGLKVIPILFNRWHDHTMDNGGIYINQMIPGSCWCSENGAYFDSYINKIVGAHSGDGRILLWDTCNEPYSYGSNGQFTSVVRPYEKKWLEKIYAMCKNAGAKQPVSFSMAGCHAHMLEEHRHICDVMLVHPYNVSQSADEFESVLSAAKEAADKLGCGILSTETCWGALTDEVRVELLPRTLGPHVHAGIGFVAHALAYSHVADLHYAEDGVVGVPGNLCFLNKDGTVRAGHEAYNLY